METQTKEANNDWAYKGNPKDFPSQMTVGKTTFGKRYREAWTTHITDLKRMGWNLPDQKNRDRLERVIAELNSLLEEAVAYEKAQAEEEVQEDDN